MDSFSSETPALHLSLMTLLMQPPAESGYSPHVEKSFCLACRVIEEPSPLLRSWYVTYADDVALK